MHVTHLDKDKDTKHRTILHDSSAGQVFRCDDGSIGLAYNSRVAVHSIERWVAYSWNDHERIIER